MLRVAVGVVLCLATGVARSPRRGDVLGRRARHAADIGTRLILLGCERHDRGREGGMGCRLRRKGRQRLGSCRPAMNDGARGNAQRVVTVL